MVHVSGTSWISVSVSGRIQTILTGRTCAHSKEKKKERKRKKKEKEGGKEEEGRRRRRKGAGHGYQTGRQAGCAGCLLLPPPTTYPHTTLPQHLPRTPTCRPPPHLPSLHYHPYYHHHPTLPPPHRTAFHALLPATHTHTHHLLHAFAFLCCVCLFCMCMRAFLALWRIWDINKGTGRDGTCALRFPTTHLQHALLLGGRHRRRGHVVAFGWFGGATLRMCRPRAGGTNIVRAFQPSFSAPTTFRSQLLPVITYPLYTAPPSVYLDRLCASAFYLVRGRLRVLPSNNTFAYAGTYLPVVPRQTFSWSACLPTIVWFVRISTSYCILYNYCLPRFMWRCVTLSPSLITPTSPPSPSPTHSLPSHPPALPACVFYLPPHHTHTHTPSLHHHHYLYMPFKLSCRRVLPPVH